MNRMQELMLMTWIDQVRGSDEQMLMSYLKDWVPSSGPSRTEGPLELLQIGVPAGVLKSGTRKLSIDGIHVNGRKYQSGELLHMFFKWGGVNCDVMFLAPCSSVVLVTPANQASPVAAFDVLEECLVSHIVSFQAVRHRLFDRTSTEQARSERHAQKVRHAQFMASHLHTFVDPPLRSGASQIESKASSARNQGGAFDERT